MHRDRRRPVPFAAPARLRPPAPMGLKLRLVARKTWLKIRNSATCRGHDGEPGRRRAAKNSS